MDYLATLFFLFVISFWVFIAWNSGGNTYTKVIFTFISVLIFIAVINQALTLS